VDTRCDTWIAAAGIDFSGFRAVLNPASNVEESIMQETIEADYQTFLADRDSAFGAVRRVAPNG